ncbi:cobalamin biosynthesis protein CobD [Caldisphaera lagunensis DSM 15908]|uniref:Probable cobalamin biosynthesis protein CobD n=1 Tax=Caldisphaera lagunensis (strain DSM 15908 / JCM 11604 / ANMR 0165 / IC-154) TaxID=1056495 RepID=L0AAE6_CALLD|nr:cobalamin biosynthesis protein [Caldisphaera lagunensis]AFZ70846.1 cobalamin biosynthesis protein CobD [Caldisphaera lagunensis DSM 15908]
MIYLPKFLYPNPLYIIASLILALILDIVYPYHKGVFYKIHPVHTSYILSQKLYKPYSSKLRGFFIWIITIGTHLLIYLLLLYLLYRINFILWIIASSYIIKTSLSFKLLYDIVKKVKESLYNNDIEKARNIVSGLVRRDTSNLDEYHISSASIESLSESFVDGILSPLFWLIIFGPIGSLMQRLINTLDGSLGFKDELHKDVGFVSALADTIINYIPARISVIIFALSSVLIGNDLRSLFSCWKKYKNKTESKNAGHPMSSFAGALKISLEKINSYRLCDYDLPKKENINNALKLILVSYIITLILTIAIIYLIKL